MKDFNSPKNVAEFRARVKLAIDYGAQILDLVTPEATEAIHQFAIVGKELGFPVVTWDIAHGFQSPEIDLQPEIARIGAAPSKANEMTGLDDPQLRDPRVVMPAIQMFTLGPPGKNDGIFIVRNPYPMISSNLVVYMQFYKAAAHLLLNSEDSHKLVVLLQDSFDPERHGGVVPLRNVLTPISFPMADSLELRELVDVSILPVIKNQYEKKDLEWTPPSEELCSALADAVKGVSRLKAEEIILEEVAGGGVVDEALIATCRDRVAAYFESEGLFELVRHDKLCSPQDLGGVDAVLDGLRGAALTYTKDAAEEGIEPDLGMYCCGVSGTGKTQVAKAAGQIFREVTGRPFDFVRLRMGNLLDKYVGESEKKWRRIEEVFSLMGDKILFIDEMDKFAGGIMNGGGDGGSQVYQSLLSYMLTFLADPEKKGSTYVIFAMNNPKGIPPELIRPGRVDLGYFFDVPSAEARQRIIEIHLRKRLALKGRSLDDVAISPAEWERIRASTDNWTPATLEWLAKEAIKSAFRETGKAVPKFKHVDQLVEYRRRLLSETDEARAAETRRLSLINEIRQDCRAVGAIPADRTTTMAAAGPNSAMNPITRNRVRGKSARAIL